MYVLDEPDPLYRDYYSVNLIRINVLQMISSETIKLIAVIPIHHDLEIVFSSVN